MKTIPTALLASLLASTVSPVAASALAAPKASATKVAAVESVAFDAANGQLPEGVYVTKDAIYAGIAGSGEVWKIARDGTRTLLGSAPAPVAGKGFLTGVIVAPNGDVIAALASFTPEVQAGLYRIPKSGGKATLFAKSAEMNFPNGLAYASSGNLLVTDSSGRTFRVSPSGEVVLVVADALLQGDKSGASSPAAPGAKFGLDIGVNGIAVAKSGHVWVVNSDKGSLLRFRYDAKKKTAGALEAVAVDGAKLGGADGIALTAAGDALVTLNTQDKIVKVTAKGAISALDVPAGLDFPASIARDPAAKGEAYWVTNAGFLSKDKRPGVVRVTLD